MFCIYLTGKRVKHYFFIPTKPPSQAASQCHEGEGLDGDDLPVDDPGAGADGAAGWRVELVVTHSWVQVLRCYHAGEALAFVAGRRSGLELREDRFKQRFLLVFTYCRSFLLCK